MSKVIFEVEIPVDFVFTDEAMKEASYRSEMIRGKSKTAKREKVYLDEQIRRNNLLITHNPMLIERENYNIPPVTTQYDTLIRTKIKLENGNVYDLNSCTMFIERDCGEDYKVILHSNTPDIFPVYFFASKYKHYVHWLSIPGTYVNLNKNTSKTGIITFYGKATPLNELQKWYYRDILYVRDAD